MGIKDETPFGAYSKDGNFTTDDSTQFINHNKKENKMNNIIVADPGGYEIKNADFYRMDERKDKLSCKSVYHSIIVLSSIYFKRRIL